MPKFAKEMIEEYENQKENGEKLYKTSSHQAKRTHLVSWM